MRFQLPDGRTVGADDPFTLEGVNYGAGWLRQSSPSWRASKNIVDAPAPTPFDERFYYGPDQAKPIDQCRAVRRGDLAAIRYARETGGITVSGIAVATDHVSQAKINGALSLVAVTPAATIKWKTSTGFVTLDGDAVRAIALAVGQHVQACFAREAELTDAINGAADLTALLAIDLNQGWPT